MTPATLNDRTRSTDSNSGFDRKYEAEAVTEFEAETDFEVELDPELAIEWVREFEI